MEDDKNMEDNKTSKIIAVIIGLLIWIIPLIIMSYFLSFVASVGILLLFAGVTMQFQKNDSGSGKIKMIFFLGEPFCAITNKFGSIDKNGKLVWKKSRWYNRLPFYLVFFPFSFWKEESVWQVFANLASIAKKKYLSRQVNSFDGDDTQVLAIGTDTWYALNREETRGILMSPLPTVDASTIILRLAVDYLILDLETLIRSGRIRDWDVGLGENQIKNIIQQWVQATPFEIARMASQEKIFIDNVNIITLLNKNLIEYGFIVNRINFISPRNGKLTQDRLDAIENLEIAKKETEITLEEAKQIENIGKGKAKSYAAQFGPVKKLIKYIFGLRNENEIAVAAHLKELYTYAPIGNMNSTGGTVGLQAKEMADKITAGIISNIVTDIDDEKGDRKKFKKKQKKGGESE